MTSKSTDTRDLRDPQKLGAWLLKRRQRKPSMALHVFADEWKPSIEGIDDYDHGESLVVDTIRQYRLELKRAAERGDKHARDTLRGIPNDDPSG